MPRAKKKLMGSTAHTLRIAAYIRVSTDEQAESGLGLASQRTRCKAMATVKEWDEPTFYEDAGISGTKSIEKRPALSRLMEDIRSGLIDVVIILSIDRLARDTRMILAVSEELREAGVNLVSCKENIDTTTPHGNLYFTLTAAFAQFERDLIAQRTKDALTERGKRNGEKGGRVPYGYIRVFTVNDRNENKSIGVQIDQGQADVVRHIFDLRQHRCSMAMIAARLNREAIISPRGGKWYASGVREILLNKADYLGGSRGDSAIPWPAILTQELQAIGR